jgi:hypothetical protein
LPLGSRVTVEGTVSTSSGAFASSFFDAGFGMQDERAGIYVSLQTDLHVMPGDRVRVTGVLADSFGLLVLLPDDPGDVDRRGHQRPPEGRRVATGAVGESTEGLVSRLALGERVKITGFSSQFEADFEIDPRFPQDVVRLTKDHDRDDCDSAED